MASKRRYIDVIYEDRDLIVVNKPRGLIVESEFKKGNSGAGSLCDNVRSYLMRKFEGARGVFIRPLHRLDKETTGLTILAKSKAGLKLSEEIKSHKIMREYVAVVEGKIEKENGTIKVPLIKGDFGHGKKVGVADKNSGKMTVTHFALKERYENASMINLRLETGFTHQIRVHLASIGHPLIGDKVYNPHGKIPFPRQALHAGRIVFYHPAGGKKIELKAPLPKDMMELIDNLRG
ncbi:MAG: RluA family pseudouridine synthase [Deltaproteobacteria bacterium]|nr:RluA family pseudouridine synthase [Deltaproteobacteria bacterium]